MRETLHEAPDRHAAPLASLCVGRLLLAVPLRDLQSLEPILDVDRQNRDGRSAGTIELRTGPCPVFCVDEALTVVGEPSPDQRICAILAGGEAGSFGIICSAVESLGGDALASFDVPACMAAADSPIDGLALHGRRVFCRTTGAALARFVTTGSADEPERLLEELDPGADEVFA